MGYREKASVEIGRGGANGSQKGAKREPKESKSEPTGAKREPKVSQGATQVHQKVDLRIRSRKRVAKGGAYLKFWSFWEPFSIKNR